MNVIIVDDDKIVESSLKTILEAANINVLASGNSGLDAIDLYKQHRPDVALLDIRMAGMTGLEATEEILRFDPTAKVLFLTTFADDEYIIKALSIGAKGYLLKQDFESIIPALTAVSAGQSVFGRDVVTKFASMMHDEPLGESKKNADPESLGVSEKEAEIIIQVARGLNNKEIGQALFLSEGTVRNYISGVLEKLQLRDRTQLAIYWHTHK